MIRAGCGLYYDNLASAAFIGLQGSLAWPPDWYRTRFLRVHILYMPNGAAVGAYESQWRHEYADGQICQARTSTGP